MRDELGIGLTPDLKAGVADLAPELGVVLDDPIMDDGDIAREMRMRVRFGRPPMGRPPCMPDAYTTIERLLRDQLLEVSQLTDSAPDRDALFGEHGEPRRIIASIFEAPQPVQKDWADRSAANITDDTAHAGLTHVVRMRSIAFSSGQLLQERALRVDDRYGAITPKALGKE